MKRIARQEEGQRQDREQRRAREQEREERREKQQGQYAGKDSGDVEATNQPRRRSIAEDFEKQRKEALERIRATQNAPLLTSTTERVTKGVQNTLPAPPVTEVSTKYAWMRHQGEHQREPETTHSRWQMR